MGGRESVRDGGQLLYLSAFSGVGGLDLGLERAGFGAIGGIENDAGARRSLVLNRPRFPLLDPHDVNHAARELRASSLGIRAGDLALLAAGPPCQSFSKAAQWARTSALGMRDEGTRRCLDSLMTLVERFLPHGVVLENVPGFVRGERSALTLVRDRLAGINERCGTRYSLSVRVLNVADFGVPQRRRRAIVIALRSGANFVWPAAIHRDRWVRAWDALRTVRPKTLPRARGRFAGLLVSVPEGENYQYFTRARGRSRSVRIQVPVLVLSAQAGQEPASMDYPGEPWSINLDRSTGRVDLSLPRRFSVCRASPGHGGSMEVIVNRFAMLETQRLHCWPRCSAKPSLRRYSACVLREGRRLASPAHWSCLLLHRRSRLHPNTGR